MNYTLGHEIVVAGQTLLTTLDCNLRTSLRHFGWQDTCFLFLPNRPLCLFEVASVWTIDAYILQTRMTFKRQTMPLIRVVYHSNFAVLFLALQACTVILVLVSMNSTRRISPHRNHATNLCIVLKALLIQLELENVLQAFTVPLVIR